MTRRETLSVSGMSCGGCERNVESALSNVEGVSRVEADHEADSVEVVADDDVTPETLATTIEDAGYEVSS